MLTVCCFYWYDPQGKWNNTYTYGPEHVNELRRQVAENLTLPHEFVCVTDKPEGIAPGIRIVPLDRTTFVPGTRFVKLMLFRPDIAKVLGERILYMDLDTVIVSNIDSIANRSEDLVLWRNPAFGTSPKRARYNTSLILLKAGSRPEFWNEFTPAKANQKIRQSGWGGTDQAWVSCLASPEEAHWEAKRDGVYGVGSMGDGLPDNARIVFFPGRRAPWLKSEKEKHPWIERELCRQ